MSNESSIHQILDKALAKTESKELTWLKSSDTEFKAIFPRSAIEVWFNEKTSSHNFSLINEDGQYVANLSTAKVEPQVKDKIHQLYKVAKNQVFKIDETITDILGHLD